jgi:hypothetical protein
MPLGPASARHHRLITLGNALVATAVEPAADLALLVVANRKSRGKAGDALRRRGRMSR